MNRTGIDGLLVLDKSAGLTSRAAVDRALTWFPRGTRMGHTGTLDPLATGVLVLCLGNATRLTEYVQRMAKTYRAGILLGARSDTDDADGTITPSADARPPDLGAIRDCLDSFVGEIDQVPPQFSAAKVTGRRAYDLARQGQTIDLQPRRVRICGIDILRYEYPQLELEVRCGKGTYIRSLARDLGERLGCGGLVAALRRTRVGPFRAENAVTLDADGERAQAGLLPAVQALAELPKLVLEPSEAQRLCHGQAVPVDRLPMLSQEETGEVAVLDRTGQLIAIGRWQARDRLLRPEKVWRGL